MKQKAYELISARAPHAAGTTVYQCSGHDYGCASDDTRMTGVHHQSITLDPNGGYPFFTMESHNLREIV